MKSIILKNVVIDNFKGIKHYERNFDSKLNIISAHFGSGKSTIRQSLNYVFGLKVDDFRPYEVKNGVWTMIEEAKATSVEWTIEVDDTVMPITYKFQVKDTGKTTSYWIDDVKYPNKKSYQEKLVEYLELTSLEQLEMVSQLDYFLTLKWDVQREILKKITNVQVELESVQKQELYKPLYEQYFIKGVGETDIRKSLKQRKKKVEQDKLINETNIKHYQTQIKEYSANDYSKIKNEIEEIDKKIRNLDDVTKKSKLFELQTQFQKLDNELMSNENEIKMSIYKQEQNVKVLENQREQAIQNNIVIEKDIKVQTDLLNEKRNETFVLKNEKCSYCGSQISEEQQKKVFDTTKLNVCSKIEKEINDLEIILTNNKTLIEKNTNEVIRLNNDIIELNKKLEETKDFYDLQKDDIELQIFNLNQTNNDKEIANLQSEKQALMNKVGLEVLLEQAKNNLNICMQEQQKHFAEEQKIYLLEELVDKYSEETQSIFYSHINSYFQNEINWQLFSKLVSTGETKEDCILLCNNKRYDTACSTGERLLARVLVVQGLQKILKVNFPIFVDDFNDLGVQFESNQQLILLETKAGVDLENIERF